MSNAVLRFDDFIPGERKRSSAEIVEPMMIDAWHRLYRHEPAPRDEVPPGMATALMMRAYMRTLTPRPPGNVHARQRLRLLGPIRPGESVFTEFECVDKVLRRDRRHLELAVTGFAGIAGAATADRTGDTADNHPHRRVFEGRMMMIWAA